MFQGSFFFLTGRVDRGHPCVKLPLPLFCSQGCFAPTKQNSSARPLPTSPPPIDLALVSLIKFLGEKPVTKSSAKKMADEKAANGEQTEDEVKADEYKLRANEYFKGMT